MTKSPTPPAKAPAMSHVAKTAWTRGKSFGLRAARANVKSAEVERFKNIKVLVPRPRQPSMAEKQKKKKKEIAASQRRLKNIQGNLWDFAVEQTLESQTKKKLQEELLALREEKEGSGTQTMVVKPSEAVVQRGMQVAGTVRVVLAGLPYSGKKSGETCALVLKIDPGPAPTTHQGPSARTSPSSRARNLG